MAGVRDEHCKPVAPGLLDGLFGIRRKGDRLRANARVRIHCRWGRVTGKLENVIVETELEPTTDQSWGRATGGVPVLFVNALGKGKACYLNFSLYSLYDLRREGRERSAMAMLRFHEVALDEERLTARAVEHYRWRDGGTSYIGLLPDI